VVLIRAEGRVFCSGADLSEASAEGMEVGARRIVDLQRLVVTMSKPVVTRVHGAVRAGGIGIVAASDLAIAADEATFALTEVKLGLAAAIISLTVHHRMNPRAAALTTLGGEVFGGREAAAYGLVTTAVPGDDLDAEVARVCASLATGAPRGCASPSGSSTATWSRGSTPRRGAGGAQRAAVRLRRGARGDVRVPVAEALAEPERRVGQPSGSPSRS
jgi:enoyl-CoA hydratase/methylglutaconyl-CoA hydratase